MGVRAPELDEAMVSASAGVSDHFQECPSLEVAFSGTSSVMDYLHGVGTDPSAAKVKRKKKIVRSGTHSYFPNVHPFSPKFKY